MDISLSAFCTLLSDNINNLSIVDTVLSNDYSNVYQKRHLVKELTVKINYLELI